MKTRTELYKDLISLGWTVEEIETVIGSNQNLPIISEQALQTLNQKIPFGTIRYEHYRRY